MPTHTQSVQRASGRARPQPRKSEQAPSLLEHWRPYIVGIITFALLIALTASYYPKAKLAYVYTRKLDFDTTVYKAKESRLARTNAEIKALSTTEGIQDYAREKFGWVLPGENAVVVSGLTPSKPSIVNTIPPVDPTKIANKETALTHIADAFFGVNTSNQAGLQKAL